MRMLHPACSKVSCTELVATPPTILLNCSVTQLANQEQTRHGAGILSLRVGRRDPTSHLLYTTREHDGHTVNISPQSIQTSCMHFLFRRHGLKTYAASHTFQLQYIPSQCWGTPTEFHIIVVASIHRRPTIEQHTWMPRIIITLPMI